MSDSPTWNEEDRALLAEVDAALAGPDGISTTLQLAMGYLKTDSGTVHALGTDGVLHLKAHGALPPPVIELIQRIPVGKGLAGLAVERAQPVTICNIQTDSSGDVRPGARQTGLEGSIVVPIFRGETAVGALGVANRGERTFDEAETALLLAIGRAIGRHLAP